MRTSDSQNRSTPVVLAVTDAITADAFLRPHISALIARGHEVHLLAGDGHLLRDLARQTGAVAWPLPLSRTLDPINDVHALVKAWRILRRIRPVATHVGTPKGGCIVGLAARLAGVERRLYVLHGLRLETEHGVRLWLLALLEFLACASASLVVAVSHSLAREVIRRRLARPSKVTVLGSGSISGVDTERFAPAREDDRQVAREALGLDRDAVVALFVGRLSVDKGIRELASAWPQVVASDRRARLLVVGDLDQAQPATADVAALRAMDTVILTGRLDDPRSGYDAADLLVLPTYREGLPTVLLEAMASAVPIVATDVTGCRDAVREDCGLLVPPRDALALAKALDSLIGDPARRRRMGYAGRERAVTAFDPDVVVNAHIEALLV